MKTVVFLLLFSSVALADGWKPSKVVVNNNNSVRTTTNSTELNAEGGDAVATVDVIAAAMGGEGGQGGEAESISTAINGDSTSAVNFDYPSRQLILNAGQVSGAGYSTAPCTVAKRSWSFGIGIGGKTKIDEACWAEYRVQAEHERAMDRDRLELERLRLEIERDRLSLESTLAEQCLECDLTK